jgi:hypothetical protein
MITDGKEIKRAKHSSLLAENDNMYDNISVAKTEKDRVFNLHALVSNEFKCTWVTVYGELFGGGYLMENQKSPVAADEKSSLNTKSSAKSDSSAKSVVSVGIAKPVQKKPWYSKDVRFYAFDIYLPETKMWIPYKRTLELFEACDFLHAKPLPLMKGTLRELIARLQTPGKTPRIQIS